MYDPHTKPDIAGEMEIMGNGRLVKARLPDQPAPNVNWFWFPLGNCHACKYYAKGDAKCRNPAITRDQFLHEYVYTNTCPKFEAGIDPSTLTTFELQDRLDVMRAVGLVPGKPSQTVEVIHDGPWSIDLAERAHREQSVFDSRARDAAYAAAHGGNKARGEYEDWADDLERTRPPKTAPQAAPPAP